MDIEKKRSKAFGKVTSIFAALDKRSASPREIFGIYRAQYGSDPPWRDLGFPDEVSFLLGAGFKMGPDGRLSFESDATHVTALIQEQKTKPKISVPPPARNPYRSNPTPSPATRPPGFTTSLGNTALSKPNNSDWMQRSPAVSRPSNASQDSKLLTVEEMIPFFKQAEEFLAGQEVSMNQFFEKVCDVGGRNAQAWLEMRRFDAATFSTFVKERLGPTIEVDGRAVVRIRSLPSRTERPAAHSVSSIERPSVVPVSSNERPVSEREPFSSAFTMEGLECGSGRIDISINDFGPDTPNFYFTPVKDFQARLELMKRLRELEQRPLPRNQIEQGAACIASCSENKKFYRASIRKASYGFVDVYRVDFGDTIRLREDHIFQIPKEFLKESVFGHPATLANVKPINGKSLFGLKELQSMQCELDGACVKAAILSFDATSHRYRVDLGDTARDLERSNLLVYAPEESSSPITNGFHSMRIQSNGIQQTVVSTIARQPTTAQTNGHAARYDASKLRVENRVLPNCETVLVIHRDSTSYVLSSDISRVLGLPQNTFLPTLEKLCIGVIGSWELSPEVRETLDAGDYNIEHSTDNVVIPIASVAPLMRAFLWAEGKSLENEKNVLKAFEKMAN